MEKTTNTFTTPKGKFLYPHVTEPDTKFNAEGTYSVKIVLGPSPRRNELMELLEFTRKASVETTKKDLIEKKKPANVKLADLPVTPEIDDNGNETGNLIFNAKLNAIGKNGEKTWAQSPTIFDAKGRPIDPKSIHPWTGTVGRISVEVFPFYTALVGAGASMRLKAVQILELVEGGQRSAEDYGFEDEEGWERETPELDAAQTHVSDDPEDDIPF